MLSLHHVIAIRTHTHTEFSISLEQNGIHHFSSHYHQLSFPIYFSTNLFTFCFQICCDIFPKKYVFLAEFTNLNIISAFGEAFITTFRTFITPLELIEKLTHRYSILCCQISEIKQKAAKECFSLLVRVVNDLT